MKFWIIAYIAVLVGCTPRFSVGNVEKIHEDITFQGAVQEGRELLLFPVIYNNDFISPPTYEELIGPLKSRHDNVIITEYLAYRNSVSDSVRQQIIPKLETVLLQEEILDISPVLDHIRSAGFRFCQLFRVRNAYTLNEANGAVKKHLTIEGEVWDVRKKGVMWRSQAVVESQNSKIEDSEIIMRGVELLYGTLPKFYFNSSERNW